MFFCNTGCSEDRSHEKKAETFIEKVLTAPDKKISEIINSNLMIEDFEEYDVKMGEAMEELLGDYVTKEIITTASYQQILLFQGNSAREGKSYEVDNVEITKHNDNNYTYEAIMNTNYTDDPVIITGSIQFDEDNFIDFMTIIFNPS